MKPPPAPFHTKAILLAAVGAVLTLAGCSPPDQPEAAEAGEIQEGFAGFVEPDFPFITTTVDARDLGSSFPDENVATRGVVVLLEDSTYAVFDPDLLRVAVGWRGEFLSLTTMAQISYQDSLNKSNQIPEVLGRPIVATGVYPGWSVGEAEFRDPRQPGPNPDDPGRGPLPPPSRARWEGLYLAGERAVLAYTVGNTSIREMFGTARSGEQVGLVRTIRTGPIRQPLTMVAAELRGAGEALAEGRVVTLAAASDDSVTMVGLADAPDGAELQVVDDRYVTVSLPAGAESTLFRVVVWRGAGEDGERFAAMLEGPTEMVAFENGGPARWTDRVVTGALLAPDTASYVVDDVVLPVANPWQRNVRPSDIAFFSDGRAAITTFEGDVWLIEGLHGELDEIGWRRYASGLYEPMSLEIVDDQIYVYSRSGLIRPQDLNGDGEADYYENFSDLPIQTLESREFPLSMGRKPGGGFYLSRGGALDNGPRTSPALMPGFRAGSSQSGSVVEVSADGRSISLFASGLREPFIGVHPQEGIVTSSDQQGNFVPSTPIYRIVEGGYYGVPATAHRDDLPEAQEAIVWIPHEVDQSGAGQAWVTDGALGFEEDALVHVSYGRPGAFRIYIDEASGGRQGAAISLSDDFSGPLLKATVNPSDGSLYVAGFQIWGTRSPGIRTLARLRRTEATSVLPEAISAGEQGVAIRFGVPLDSGAAVDLASYTVARWNYERTSDYGSGHFRLDGTPGEERLPVAAAHLSDDRRTLLLVLPDMREVMQMQIAYDVRAESGLAVTDTLYLTVNEVPALDLVSMGLGGIQWRESIAAVGALQEVEEGEASVEQGQEIFTRVGCVACHSVDGSTAGKLGPTLQGLFGSQRPLSDGASVRADADYVRRSIEAPGSQIVEGFEEGMPAYLGVLSDVEIESLVLYIRSLGE